MRSPTTGKEEEMNWKDVGVVAAKAAPVLGAVLGGPVGTVKAPAIRTAVAIPLMFISGSPGAGSNPT